MTSLKRFLELVISMMTLGNIKTSFLAAHSAIEKDPEVRALLAKLRPFISLRGRAARGALEWSACSEDIAGYTMQKLRREGFAYAVDHPDDIRAYLERGDFPPALQLPAANPGALRLFETSAPIPVAGPEDVDETTKVGGEE